MASSFPILHTKLHIPRLRLKRVLRPRLMARLDESLKGKLVVISAPAGAGKTTLLVEWIESREARRNEKRPGTNAPRFTSQPAERFAWLSLDEADNDPIHFLAYTLASLRHAAPGLGEHLMEAILSPQPPPLEGALIGLLNELADLPGRIILVLDDYHTIHLQTIHEALAFLVDHLPSNLLLAIASRCDPPLPLPRLRTRGQAVELRQEDLRFTAEEASQFLSQTMGLELTPAQVAILEQRTEGWIAGLQMAAVSLRGRNDISAFLDSFSGSHRFILDYLMEEVLERQPAEIQAFLLQTAILDRLCAPLCAAVLGAQGNGEQEILERLERSNLFIIPLDDQRRWYRYHHLFAELLRQRLEAALQEEQPGKVGISTSGLQPTSVLHLRASTWYAAQGLLPEAIEHCLVAQDYPAAAGLIVRAAEDTLRYSETTTLLGWLEALPEAVILNYPELCLYHALAMVISGQSLERVESRLLTAQTGSVPASLAAGAAALDCIISSFRGDYQRGAACSQRAMSLLSETSSFLGSLVTTLLGLYHVFIGDLPAARQTLFQALEISQKAGNPMTTVLVRCQIADLDSLQGRLHKAYDFYQETLQQAVDRHGQPLPIAGMACIGLGEIQREWNNLPAAEELLLRGLELCRRWGEFTAFDGHISLARVRQAQCEPAAAWAAISQATNIARQFDLSDLDDRMVECHAARLLISQGNLEAARRWLEKSELDSPSSPEVIAHLQGGQGEAQPLSKTFPVYYLREIECFTAARLFLAQNRPSEALSVIHDLLEPAEKGLRLRSVAEILILQSLAHDRLGNQPQALHCLSRAIALAQPEGYIRLFADEGAPLTALLLRVKQQSSPDVAPYLNRLLAALPGTSPIDSPISPRSTPTVDQLVDPLSSRELEVLQYLAAGLSNDEIANRLTVALSTVKTHVHKILNKLGATSRLAAVQRAREIGLLEQR